MQKLRDKVGYSWRDLGRVESIHSSKWQLRNPKSYDDDQMDQSVAFMISGDPERKHARWVDEK